MLARLCSKSFKLGCSMNWELPDVQAEFRKGRGTRDQIANICWITEKTRELKKYLKNYCFIDYTKAFDCVDHNKLWKMFRDGNFKSTYLSPEIHMQVKKQQWQPDIEQWAGSKLGKAYIKAVYCHIAYFTSM